MFQQKMSETELNQYIKTSEADIKAIESAMLDDFAKLGEERTFQDYYQSIDNFTQLMRASLTPSAVTAAGQNVKMLVDFSQAAQLQMNSLCDQYKIDATF